MESKTSNQSQASTNQDSPRLEKSAYQGSPSTLCKGCGHDAITSSIVNALYETCADPTDIIKLSGIGCSSKTPNYFLSSSFGFNSIHGRMAPLATGVHLSQPQAKIIGVSGDGDTASIGLGGFLHLIRRNVPVVYIVANNGVYGLTKGQFSATSEVGDSSKLKSSQMFSEIDVCIQALGAGCEFVARGFSGDQKQLKRILELALTHPGTALIDIISPCVAYGNHEGFSKSYTHTKEIAHPLQEIDLIPEEEDQVVPRFKITPLEGTSHDFTRRDHAIQLILDEKNNDILHTGILYKNPSKKTLIESLNGTPDNKLEIPEKSLRIPKVNFEKFNSAHSIGE